MIFQKNSTDLSLYTKKYQQKVNKKMTTYLAKQFIGLTIAYHGRVICVVYVAHRNFFKISFRTLTMMKSWRHRSSYSNVIINFDFQNDRTKF